MQGSPLKRRQLSKPKLTEAAPPSKPTALDELMREEKELNEGIMEAAGVQTSRVEKEEKASVVHDEREVEVF